MTTQSAEPINSTPQVNKNTVEAVVEGKKMSFGYSFYRGDTANFQPTAALFDKADALRKFVLKGWMPAEPFIDADTNIIAFGSCFASNISNYLNNIGFNVATKKDTVAYVSRLGDGIVNTYALRQQFEWAWENRVPTVDLWHGYKAEEFGYDERVRVRTKELFDAADVFIITLGLSEVWYDEPTGEVFWRAVPYKNFDPSRHKFRVLTHEESLTNLRAIYELIRKHRPEAGIVFTVSPIPLAATFRDLSCITANAVSKAILRSAVDQLYREKSPGDPKLFYFPSYEVVLECFRHQFGSDRRHAHPHVLDVNMKAFERFFCKTGLTDEQIDTVFAEARALDRGLGGEDSKEVAQFIREQRERIHAEKRSLPRNNKDSIQGIANAAGREARQAERAARREAAKARGSDALQAERAARRAERKAGGSDDGRQAEREARRAQRNARANAG